MLEYNFTGGRVNWTRMTKQKIVNLSVSESVYRQKRNTHTWWKSFYELRYTL